MSDTLSDLMTEFDGDVAVSSPTALDRPRRVMKKLPEGDVTALEKREVSSEEVDLAKPWMKLHSFELVFTADRVRELVDEALRVGRVALDTETQGLDTRIEYREDGSCYTHDAIIGYCLGLEGKGYYIPVRHEQELATDRSPNVDSVARAEAEITRLCQAAQPILKEGVHDVLGAKEKDFEVPPRVIIEFWHAKFDQEMLYPITGIDLWNPYSFDDGMLMVYVLCTEDEQGLKENALLRLPPIKDPESGAEHKYEMIEFPQLFPKGMKKRERHLQKLVPREEGQGRNVVLYGCSDGICTNLLCAVLKPKVQAKKNFQSFYTLEKQVAQVVRVIERTRVLINKGEISSLLREAEEELSACEERIRKLAVAAGFPSDFNPSSSAQLAEFLFGTQGIWKGEKPEKTSEGQYKTDEKTIEIIAKDPRAKDLEAFTLIIKHRQINKVRGTYLQNLASNTDELDQLRLNFRQTGAATGRFTAPKGDPEHGYAGLPIQGIPARDDPKKPKVAHSLRRMFIARPGYVIVKADYASQELRIASSTSGEQKWIAEYEKEAATGEPADLHFLTAQAFYPGLTKDSPDYKIKRNGGKCVHPDTLVVTQDGLRPLGTLGEYGRAGAFVDAPKGLMVDGNPVVSLYNGGLKELVHVIARRGALTCTREHRFKTSDGRLVRAGELVDGMTLEGLTEDGGVEPVKTQWRDIASAGPYLARHHYCNGAPAQISAIKGDTVELTPCDRSTPNEVLAVIAAGRQQCLDITMGTTEHLYRANGILTHNTANFALIYGGGVGAVQRATGCDKVEGARMKQAFDDSVPNFSRWVKRQHAAVKKNLGVSTAFGRFIAIPGANLSRDEVLRRFRNADKKFSEEDVRKEIRKGRAACERMATNYPIQGAGADILKISLVLLLREFQLRKWLRNGGDDSVRIIMTVHDEIVFEIREERIAEAVPVIIRIMEFPGKLVNWRVPLVAEVELGPSWAAHIKWSGLFREPKSGEKAPQRPQYLEAVEVDHHPHVLVLDAQPSPEQAASKPLPPVVAPAPLPEEKKAADPVEIQKPTAAPHVPALAAASHVNGSAAPKNGTKSVASIKLNTMHVDWKTVCLIAQACVAAKIEAMKEGQVDQEVPVEFLLGCEDDVILYSAKENYRVHVRELTTNLRRINLLHSFVVRDEIHD